MCGCIMNVAIVNTVKYIPLSDSVGGRPSCPGCAVNVFLSIESPLFPSLVDTLVASHDSAFEASVEDAAFSVVCNCDCTCDSSCVGRQAESGVLLMCWQRPRGVKIRPPARQ